VVLKIENQDFSLSAPARPRDAPGAPRPVPGTSIHYSRQLHNSTAIFHYHCTWYSTGTSMILSSQLVYQNWRHYSRQPHISITALSFFLPRDQSMPNGSSLHQFSKGQSIDLI
jgi:hypothetical protein